VSALRVVYFGTPDFAVPALQRLLDEGCAVTAAVTQPDRPRGRGQRESASPVKELAAGHGIPVLQPDRLKDEAFLDAVRSLAPDLGVVAAYGRILPQALLDIPRLGMINVHASLLPRWRGASPVHRAVMAGDAETGISIMRVVKALDAGGVFHVVRRAIGPNETSGEVERDLAALGAEALMVVVRQLEAGTARETPQDESGVSYAPRLTKEEGLVGWSAPAPAIHDQVRGLLPWPRAFTSLDAARVILLETAVRGEAAPPGAVLGEVVAIEDDHVVVAAGNSTLLRLVHLQLEGRRAVSGREFAAGTRLKPGRRFGVWPQ
jgi:methionyl-tRNA formyltransferase